MVSLGPPEPIATHPSIHEAVYSPNLDLDAVEAIIKEDPSCLNSVNSQSGFVPLHESARRAHSGLIQLLIRYGANLEVRWKNGETAFLIACQSGSLFAVHAFMEGGANVRAVDNSGKGAIHYAAQVGAVHIVHYLSVTRGLGLHCMDNDGNTPLHAAVTNRNLETIRYLLKYNRASAGTANNYGSTPLHVAAVLGSAAMAWLLVSSTKENLLDCRDKNGYLPLDHCAMGKTPRHATLAKKMRVWSAGLSWWTPWLWWLLYFLSPGTSLLLAMLAFCHLHLVVGVVLAIVIVIVGFFRPFSPHRLPHDSKWPNPALFGALISGLIHTSVCYFTIILPQIWPDNLLWFTVVISSSVALLYILIKFKLTDPGFDRVGRTGSDGNPLTIIDVARQGNQGNLQFCTACEIVTPERAKHCKLCEGCCHGFDHHCIWLTSCVGYNNHPMFVLFTFFLGLDNFLFVWEAFSCLAMVTDSYSPTVVLTEALFVERWILFVIICNFCTGVFAFLNLSQQISLISQKETTYFDMSGRPAYNKKRERSRLSLATRLTLIRLFFTNYPKWFHINNPSESYQTTLNTV